MSSAEFPEGAPPTPPPTPVNPYAAMPSSSMAESPAALVADAGMVGHMQVISILQIVFGVMELFMGGILLFYGVFFSVMAPSMNNGPSPPPPELMLAMGIGSGILGGLVFLFSILRIVAGIRSFWFAGRTMMMISLIGGMITAFTCYCAPFSIGLGIYGLVVMLNPAVKQAFKMASEGMPPEQIRAHFARARYGF